MRFEMRRLHETFAIATLYVTHDQAEAMVIADRVDYQVGVGGSDVVLRVTAPGAPVTLAVAPEACVPLG
jgi:ABC-type sugar transport system ATPase subunit